ncbi:unnamed protein product, partial [Discosporangium mesarthrocarpum]
VWEIPAVHRTSYRTRAAEAGVALSTLWDLCKHEEVQSVRRWIKPVLSEAHKLERVQFVLSHVSRKGGTGWVVAHMYDWVHVDEEWFYMMRDGGRIYLHPDTAVPDPPRAQKKRYVTMVMFLVAGAMPRKLFDGSRFDGKIGIWPVVEMVATKKNSKNRPVGTLEIKPVTVDGEKYQELMVNKVVPAIKARMPGATTRTIFVQQDGRVVEAIEESNGGYIAVETQPPNSPDLNMLDRSFFHSIHRLKDDAGFMEAFDVYPRETLERSWHCLFAIYSEVLVCKGDNNFPLPHNAIRQAQAEGALPEHVRVDAENIASGMRF